MNRRCFIERSARGAAGVVLARSASTSSRALAAVREAAGQERLNAPATRGSYYKAEVPDTLDLAEQARLGLNYFSSIIEESLDCEMYLSADLFYNPPILRAFTSDIGACQPKALEAMAFLRLMSGSTQGLDIEAKMMRMMVSLLGEGGLYWVNGSSEKPWLGIPEPFVMVHGQARMVRAMIAWHQYTGNPDWKGRIDRLIDGLDRVLAVHKDDYAYFPVYGFYDREYLRSCYTRRGWRDTVEPTTEKFGEENSLFNHQGHTPGALATWHRLTGNPQALALAAQLVRFYTRPKFWADADREYPKVVGPERAHWQGHFHGYVNTLRAILEYAVAANDARLKGFVRDGYEWARQRGLARIGYVGDAQGCGCGRLIGLAVKLTDAGVGDYWEDVDQYIRNQGTEMQIVPEDADYLRRLSEGKPPPPKERSPSMPGRSAERVLERIVGGFAGKPNKEVVWLCCSPHGSMGLFYAWDGALRHQQGTVRINLLLNRASPWMDVDSWLPYEGKVVLRKKSAREAFVRIPAWADRKTVACALGDRAIEPSWLGSYVRFRDLRPGDRITLRFPITETTEEWTIPKLRDSQPGPERQVHRCRFRGNTLVEISPPLAPGSPLYQNRARRYAVAAPPLHTVTRYVTPAVLQW